MQRILSAGLLLLAAVMPLGLTGCATISGTYAAVADTVFMMSPAEEEVLAEEVKKQVVSEMTLVQDPQLVGYVTELGNELWAVAPQSVFTPDFFVVDDPALNAFAIPGGNVYINTGIIMAADDESELAGVMAHELGHVVGRHSARQVSRSQGAAIIQQMLLGGDASQTSQFVSQLLQAGVMSHYSRDHERESDRIAVAMLDRAGLDPMGMYRLLQTLRDRYGTRGSPLDAVFATHPATDERMASVREMVGQLRNPPTHRPTERLNAAQARIRELGLDRPEGPAQ